MREESIINAYLKDIRRFPLLSFEEEIELAKKAQAGNKAARDKLVNSNLRFVITIAKKYHQKGMELEDLIGEGNIGLMTAIDKFDVNKGYKFISYAVWWIRQSILRAISDKSRAIRIPVNKANDISMISKTLKEVKNQNSDKEDLKEVARILNMKESYVIEMMNITKEMVSLDSVVEGKDSAQSSLVDFVEDTVNSKPDEELMNESLKDEINVVMKTLLPAERSVLSMRFGLNGEKPQSLKEIGEKFNLTKERIRQIEKKALFRMQNPSRKERLSAYVA